MRVLGYFLAASLGVFLAACGSTSPATSARTRAASPPGYISLERTPNAAGQAVGPVYVVTLFSDGRVIFEGYAQVKHKGTFSRTISPEAAEEVFQAMDSINLWDRERRYDIERANRGGDSVIVRTASQDVPTDIIRAQDRGRSIRIDGLFFAPSELLRFKELVERTVGLAAWVGSPAEQR